MSEFKIYENNSSTSESYPFLIDVQSDLLSGLDTRLVIPMIKSEEIGRHLIRNLNPSINFMGNEYIVMTQQMAAIPKVILGNAIEEAKVDRTQILSAIDFLITGI